MLKFCTQLGCKAHTSEQEQRGLDVNDRTTHTRRSAHKHTTAYNTRAQEWTRAKMWMIGEGTQTQTHTYIQAYNKGAYNTGVPQKSKSTGVNKSKMWMIGEGTHGDQWRRTWEGAVVSCDTRHTNSGGFGRFGGGGGGSRVTSITGISFWILSPSPN